jgi:hypothetical protein
MGVLQKLRCLLGQHAWTIESVSVKDARPDHWSPGGTESLMLADELEVNLECEDCTGTLKVKGKADRPMNSREAVAESEKILREDYPDLAPEVGGHGWTITGTTQDRKAKP